MYLAYFLALASLTSVSTTAPADLSPAARAGNALPDILSGCKDTPADMYFMVDCSSSVWIVDFEKELELVVSLVNQFNIHPNATRVGLGIFSDNYYPVIDIGAYPDKDTLIRAIRATPYLSGNTYTGKGINGMRTHGFREGIVRPNVTKVGMVITDGRSPHRTNTVAEATMAREAHIWLFAVGIGPNVDQEELASIASEPIRDFSFHVRSFNDLPSLVPKLTAGMCSLEQPQADGATCGKDKKADVMFLYNAAEMSSHSLSNVRQFMKYVIGEFSMTPGNVRAGVISQGCNGDDMQLSQYLRKEELIQALDSQTRPQLAPLLKKVRLQGFHSSQGGRFDAQKIAIVFIDDVLADRNNVLYETWLIKYDGVVVYVITVGGRRDLSEAKQLATSPSYITHFDSFNDLQTPAKRQAFRNKLCEKL